MVVSANLAVVVVVLVFCSKDWGAVCTVGDGELVFSGRCAIIFPETVRQACTTIYVRGTCTILVLQRDGLLSGVTLRTIIVDHWQLALIHRITRTTTGSSTRCTNLLLYFVVHL